MYNTLSGIEKRNELGEKRMQKKNKKYNYYSKEKQICNGSRIILITAAHYTFIWMYVCMVKFN